MTGPSENELNTSSPNEQFNRAMPLRTIPNGSQASSNQQYVTARFLGGVNDIGSVRYVKHATSRVTQPVFPRPKFAVPIPSTTPIHNPTQSHHVERPFSYARPAAKRLQSSRVLQRKVVSSPEKPKPSKRFRLKRSYSKMQLGLTTLAVAVFAFGVAINIQSLKTNHQAAAQIAVLSKKSSHKTAAGDALVPSTTKPSPAAFKQYTVAPDLARYLKIPKLSISARVLQVGVTPTGVLGTPNNVFDAAWYTGSAKPGQPGATLIDGHVSSWTTHGVFYGIKKLVNGDAIQIVKGDGSIVNYKVIKTVIYSASNVDMQAAVSPVTSGKSGLNLITCTGDVIKGTSQYSERVIVFSEQD